MKTTMKTIGLAAVTVLTLVGCGGGGGSDTPTQASNQPYPAPAISESLKNEYLNAVNAARSVGRICDANDGYYSPPAPPLTWDNALYTASYEHSQDMQATGYFEHDGSGTESDWTAQVLSLGRGSNPAERVDNNNNGISYSKYFENIASGANSTSSVMTGWLASPSHCGAIMDGTIKYLGMARVGGYWTMELAE